jgi:hypothetical protein
MQNKIIKINRWIACVAFILALISLSLSRVPRWDLLDHFAMADQFNSFGSLYPVNGSNVISGVSCYFPGVSALAVIASQIFPRNADIIALHLVASIVTIIFTLSLTKIAGDQPKWFYLNGETIYVQAALLLVLNEYISYSVEFKPDTLAFVLGFFGLMISGALTNQRVSSVRFFAGTIVAGTAVIFKQQHVFFICGMVLASCLKCGATFRIFTLVTVLVCGLTLLLLLINDGVMYYNVSIFSDDGFLTMREWLSFNFVTIIKLISLLFVVLIISKMFGGDHDRTRLSVEMEKSQYRIWFSILACVALGAMLSSVKRGGNAGNTQYALAVLIPVVFLVVKNLVVINGKCKLIVEMLAVIIVVMQSAKFTVLSVIKYDDIFKIQEFVSSISCSSESTVLSGSDVYYASRMIGTKKPIANYWTMATIKNRDPASCLQDSLNSQKFDYLVVENWPLNLSVLDSNKNYKIIFTNKIGIVAQKVL